MHAASLSDDIQGGDFKKIISNRVVQLAVGSLLVVLLLFVFLNGEPTLDTSSEDSMKESVDKIMSELSPIDQKQFKETLTGNYMIAGLASLGGEESGNEVESLIDSKLDGKTEKEIFELAEDFGKEMNK